MTNYNQMVRDKMSDGHKYPCCWCSNDVVAVDMPKVSICKPCYAKLRKEKPEVASRMETWRQFLKRCEEERMDAVNNSLEE